MSIRISIPDLGVDAAEVIELLVKPGDKVEAEQGLVMVESDKASMEIPSPHAGTLLSLAVKVGDQIASNQLLGVVSTVTDTAKKPSSPQTPVATPPQQHSQPTEQQPTTATPQASSTQPSEKKSSDALVYAGPAVRKLARHLGVELTQVTPSGANNRILKEDVHGYVRNALTKGSGVSQGGAVGSYTSAAAGVDFSQFGEVRIEPMTRLHQLTADNMTKTSLVVPQVTQFDNADITDLEVFRKSMQDKAAEQGVKLTLVAFLVMVAAKALRAMPQLNVSIDTHNVVHKDYCNIGLAVDTPAGLMVPVIKDADTKSLYKLAAEIAELAAKARKKALKPAEMQGGCFTISSLGGIGGSNFTPLVNHPEVAILGVCKSSMQPVWNGKEFVPRLICPLALSYDHRAVNGADGARFLRVCADSLEDPRRLLL